MVGDERISEPMPSGSPEGGRTDPKRIQRIRRLLLRWGREHFRSFPWRSDRDLYRSLITEILLKQTTAERVVNVRQELVTRFPNPAALAAASHNEVVGVIKALGFAEQRTAQLIAVGQALVDQPPGRNAHGRLLELPGVGPYTAAAIECFAWGRAEPALDVNVARIVMRLFGVDVIRGEPRRSRVVFDLARALVVGRHPREMNWALLDLGADVCRPVPICHKCPVASVCAHALQAPQATAMRNATT